MLSAQGAKAPAAAARMLISVLVPGGIATRFEAITTAARPGSEVNLIGRFSAGSRRVPDRPSLQGKAPKQTNG